jgi:hypothetical protein
MNTRTLICARSPRFANAEHTSVFLLVTFAELPQHGELYFHAHKDDVEPHGPEILKRALSGEFGTIGRYVPDPNIEAMMKPK